jgi:transcriptional regulator NrdR family protein
MTDPCPTTDCIGTLATATSKRLSTGSIKRRRECKCCGRVEVAIVRPAVVVAVRVVKNGKSEKIPSRNLTPKTP